MIQDITGAAVKALYLGRWPVSGKVVGLNSDSSRFQYQVELEMPMAFPWDEPHPRTHVLVSNSQIQQISFPK